METIIKTAFTTRRLPSSRNGNPRYEIRDAETGNIIGTTRPDSSIAYGPVPNNAGRGVCRVTVWETPSGRRYVQGVERI